MLDENPFEVLEPIQSIKEGITRSVINDVVKNGAKDSLRQLSGTYEKSSPTQTGGDLQPGQELDLKSLKSYKGETTYKKSENGHTETIRLTEYGHEYQREILHAGERKDKEQTHEIQMTIDQILVELRRVVDSSQALEAKFQVATVQQRVTTPGKYHQTFFEWLLITIQQARMQIEDSGAWLAAMSSKKSKQSYWSMFKTHGTSFGMSNERSVATQTG